MLAEIIVLGLRNRSCVAGFNFDLIEFIEEEPLGVY